MTKTILRGVTLAAISAVALAGCGTTSGHYGTNYNDAVLGQTTPEQSAVPVSVGVAIDIYTGFDANGHINPDRPLTRTESVMIAEIEMRCADKVQEIEGLAREYLKNGTSFSITGALFYAASAAGIPGANVAHNAIMGGGGFAASSVVSTNLVWQQSKAVYYHSCVTNWVSKNANEPGDRRLRDIIVNPLLVGRVPRPSMGSDVTPRSDADDFDATSEGPVSTIPIPITPM